MPLLHSAEIGKDSFLKGICYAATIHETGKSAICISIKEIRAKFKWDLRFEIVAFFFISQKILTSLDIRASTLKSILGLTVANFMERNYKVTQERKPYKQPF